MSDLPPYSPAAKSLPRAIYEHYKGNRYQVLAVGRHSETLEEVVIYQDLQAPEKVWVRPLGMFLETTVQNGEVIPRFRLATKS